MSLSIDRANLPGSGSAKITFNSVTLWTRGDIVIPLQQSLAEQVSSQYGRVTRTRQGRKIEFSLPLWGAWTNLSTLFPSYFLNFVYGARIFGTSDLPMVILARNGDQLTIKNVRLTGMTNLKLAANQQVFTADAKFTALIANNTAPTTSNSFYAMATAQSYSEGDFPQSPFKALAWTGAWGSRTGLTTIMTQDGWDVDWEISVKDDLVDGIGPVDMFVENCWLQAKCIPVGPTIAQLDATINLQGSNADVGAVASADKDNLILTDGTSTLTIYDACVSKGTYVFAPFKKRNGEFIWTPSDRSFTSNAPTAIAAVA